MEARRPLARILSVEDEADIRVVLRLTLESVGGFSVKCCASGAEAIAIAAQFAPDLLLLDVMLPVMDGPATLRALRGLPGLANTPAIFVTARAQPEDTASLVALGAIGVITKPFNPMALPGVLREIWDRQG